ncbi:MAG: N-acetylneuraminate synthase family protein [Elusimicrobia bacterium]|nr:N-acetylneuraminate synthase family protein [Elusimicrobiota bacterium]MDE2425044.1 N-acetylneuraminate synthase family protein [Elusimicrobiota bacterium]
MKPKAISIAGRRVADGQPCFIIAEAGSNHDGSLPRALKLVDAAAEAGADAVKFQVFRARTLYPNLDVRPRYLKTLGVDKPIYQVISEMEMPFSWIPKLAARCRRRRILFLATPFDEECADRLEPFVPAWKIASYELTHAPLLRHVLRTGKPLLLSTGGADQAEIDRVLSRLRGGVALFQCTAKYPAPDDSLNLRAIPEMKRRYGVPVGLSDHSTDPVLAPVAAAALGANLIEKHFTLSRRLKGPDHSYALEPGELRGMVRAVRRTEAMLGSGRKRPHPVEADLREYRRGIFTIAPVAAGERLTRATVAVLRRGGRPETDLPPERWPWLLKRRARRALKPHTLLSLSDVRG